MEQNVDLPDYLPEDESPSQEPDKAVTRVGNGQDGNSWLGAATNFLSRSFYWWPARPPLPPVNLPTNQNPPAATSHRCLSELERQRWERASNSERQHEASVTLMLLSQVRRADSGVSLKSDDVLTENGSICSNQIVLTDRNEASRTSWNFYLFIFDLTFLPAVCFQGRAAEFSCAFRSSQTSCVSPSAQLTAASIIDSVITSQIMTRAQNSEWVSVIKYFITFIQSAHNDQKQKRKSS